ncbi:hypothetical protein [Kitasatospora sp. NBC_01300]|uniref:golvesin C-terminal-like domain-containing protein n=1 Tax=Kitasatospora sp. NBC_01300 TaxID=2903574 RepID=UPI00352D772A|nr:hypothetical protein OG556_31100 [Kitasatospora sp. NBC_01300]
MSVVPPVRVAAGPSLPSIVVEGQGARVGKDRSGRGSRTEGAEGGGIQLPAVAWVVPEELGARPASSASAASASAASVKAEPAKAEPAEAEPAAVAAAGAVPAVEAAKPATGAAAAAAEAPAGVTAVPGPSPVEEEGSGPRRISRPMVAAAVIAGLVLVGVPLGIAKFGGDDPGPSGADGPPPAGYTQQDGGNGFVPGADAHGNPVGEQPVQAAAQPVEGPPPGDAGAAAAGGAAAAAGGAVPDQGGGQAVPVAGRAPVGGGAPSTSGKPDAGKNTGGGAPANQGGGGGGGGGGGTAAGGGGGAPQTQPQTQNQPQPPPAAAQQPPPSAPAQPPAKPAQPAPPPAPSFAAVAGPGCSGGGAQARGWYDKGQEGWRNNSGGYSGDGCNGGYYSMPMSGDANKDHDNSVVWTFSTGSVTTGTCKLSVYVPNSGDVKAVGGTSSLYTVQSGSGSGSFNVNQVGNRGQWVTVGPFQLNGGKLAVTLHDRGQDWQGSDKNTYAHHAASAIRANCTG